MSLRERLTKRCQYRLSSLTISEWEGETVWVRSLGASDLAELMDSFGFFDSARKPGDRVDVDITTLCRKGLLYWLLVRSICDQDGALQFAPGDESLLAGGDVRALMQIAGEALKLSVEGLAEGAAGNSESAPSGASSTGSALPSESPTPTTCLLPPDSSEDGLDSSQLNHSANHALTSASG